MGGGEAASGERAPQNHRHLASDEMSANVYKCRRFIHNRAMKQRERVLDLLREKGLLQPRDLVRAGLRPAVLWDLVHEGLAEQAGRGLYRLAGSKNGENVSLVEATKGIQHGVVCLLTALRFHSLTTQLPHRVWIAIDRKARKPKPRAVQLEIVRFSGKALTEGVGIHRIEGVPVRITNPARTVADCFKYRNKIGLDVAVEALRDSLRDRKVTATEISRFAKFNRVLRIMRPYLEAMI